MSLLPLSPIPMPRQPRPDQSQEEVVVHCDVCKQSQAAFAVQCLGDFSERNVWATVKEKAELAGWRLDGDVKLSTPNPDARWICPMCVHRARTPMKLAKFSGNRPCLACGHRPVAKQFEPAPHPHLRRQCSQCGYAWNEAMRTVGMDAKDRAIAAMIIALCLLTLAVCIYVS